MSDKRNARSNELSIGSIVRHHELVTIGGARIPVPDENRMVHLQFRRFAGCPVCNLHLRAFVRRHDEIVAAGVREVVVFHSSAEQLREHEAGLPFAVIADPGRRLYREFGVESSPRALLDPRAWPSIVRGVLQSLVEVIRGERPIPPLDPDGGSLGLPADFLIDGDGRVVACKYGVHADDQWSVDEMLDRAREASSPVPTAAPTVYAYSFSGARATGARNPHHTASSEVLP